MEKVSELNIFDLAVVGNGIAAQYFLWNLSNRKDSLVSFSQTFSIAHVHAKEMAPPCSLRSSATVSLNGIEEDVSQLGNDMREAFFLFDDVFKNHQPEGVEEIPRVVVSTNENDTKKLTRRYKTLIDVKSERLKLTYPGSVYNSYVITPEVFSGWLTKNTTINKSDFPFFVRDITNIEDYFHLKLHNGEVVKARKILFAIGAFAKIFEKFYSPPEAESIEIKNMIKAGAYLERDIDLGNKSFYLSIDGNQVLYRKNDFESKLIIGSVTTVGAYEAPDVVALSALLLKLKDLLTFDVGALSDYKVITGLRHKGPKRLVICSALDSEKKLFRINGLYKNGYTLGLLGAKRMTDLIFT